MDSESSANLFEEILEGEPTFQFTNVDAMESGLQDLSIALTKGESHNECLVFENVPYRTLMRMDRDRSSLIFRSKLLYFHEKNIAKIKMPSKLHDTLAMLFSYQVCLKVEKMGAYSILNLPGSADQDMSKVTKTTRSILGTLGRNYVTTVLEVGLSESSRKLALEARLWLERPESRVTQVVTA
jgi:hypothetical protein